ncbi:MAG: XRE family transcriptional regulator [Actinobacteria bacterium]|nr:XRE family transcriptional regulator [Actinomycetota bacterium]
MDEETAHEWTTAGERIRVARESAGMSVRELSRRIGVSASHVSQVERGLASFSVRALYNVVSALGISMDSLFEEVFSTDLTVPLDEVIATSEYTPLDEAGIVLRGTSRPTINLRSGPRWERLTAKAEVGAEFIEVIYKPAPDAEPPVDFIRHVGREYGIIISGSLNVQVGFGEAELQPGDSIAFDSSIPHRFWNSKASQVVAVWFILDSARGPDSAADAISGDFHHSS